MSKPVGTITRGTTAPNRLRRIDRWILHSECGRLRSETDPIVVDLGYGASPITAAELRNRLQENVRPDLKVVGIEIDPERVRAAESLKDSTLDFIRGGFEIPTPHKVSLVRAANVLRQYDESEVLGAWQLMATRVTPGGLLVDATCDEIGRRGCWVGVRIDANNQPVPETFTISTHVASLEKPSDVAARLPKILIHRNVPGEKIYDLLNALDSAWERSAAARAFGARAHWVATIEYANAHGIPVLDNRTRWRLGEVSFPWALVSP